MVTKLTERARVKDLLAIARADTFHDSDLKALIEQTSEEVERITRRNFALAARVEFFKSYDNDGVDPWPQYIHLDFPIDQQATFEIIWALYGRHDTDGILVDPEDFRIDFDTGIVTIHGSSNVTTQILPLGRKPWWQFSPDGFRVTYTGGFPVTVAPSGPEDPLDDFDVVQVPQALQYVVARKIKQDFTECGMCQPWTAEQREWLKPWTKKDILFS